MKRSFGARPIAYPLPVFVIGEIVDVKIDETVLGTDGKPDLRKIGAFAFDVMKMEYYSLGTPIGRAWDAGKKFKQ